jgi:hypothetical protein
MKKEILFSGFVLLLFYGIHGFPLNFNAFLEDTTIDINVHDTYLVITNTVYLLLTLSFTFAVSYFVRVVSTKFQNQYANYIYLISNFIFFAAGLYIIWFFNSVFTDFKALGYEIEESMLYVYYMIIAFLILAFVMEIFVFLKVKKRRQVS